MADTKISALTALAAADIATDDEMVIVDTSVTTTKKIDMSDLSARTETMTNKTLTIPVIGGTAASAGALGYDTTQKMNTNYGGATAIEGRVHRTIAVGVGTETLTNSVATDQDFTSIYTFPANSIYTNKVYRVTFMLESVTGTSSVTHQIYMKLGSTKVYTMQTPTNAGDGVTRSSAFQLMIFGRAAAGAAAATTTMGPSQFVTSSGSNSENQPVNLATNGALAVTPGVVWSGTGSTDTFELQAWIVEELN